MYWFAMWLQFAARKIHMLGLTIGVIRYGKYFSFD
jgi:hypothetical protein